MKNEIHEKILVEGIKEHNEKVFDYLFHLYYSSLVVFCEKMVSDRDVAEDIVQGFFVSLWLNSNDIQINQSIKSYFFTSVRNRSFDHLRHQKVKDKAEKRLLEEGKTHDDHNFMLETELRQYIDKALDKLPPVCREVFVMNRFEGLRPAEIAEKKGISVRTVEGHIGKALKIMKTELEQFLPASLVILILKTIA